MHVAPAHLDLEARPLVLRDVADGLVARVDGMLKDAHAALGRLIIVAGSLIEAFFSLPRLAVGDELPLAVGAARQ